MKTIRTIFFVILGLLLLGSGRLSAQTVTPVAGGLTSDFITWLNANGYSSYGFQRADLVGGSYGGKQSATDTVVNEPIIFIHGNSDKALGTGVLYQSGWTASIEYFLSKGYKSSELYATTWGPADSLLASQQYHSKAYLTQTRAFIQAVLAYTGAAKVNIISHSMGVTLARKAILGGTASDALAGGSYNLGTPLTSFIDTFVGIAGANWGLTSCYTTAGSTPTCATTNGFYPGYAFGPMGLSSILTNINSTSHYEGSHVYTLWSHVDEIIMYGDVVWGRYTSEIPGQNGEVTSTVYGHDQCKDLTGYNQWRMVTAHATN
ncbi:MAG: lipase family protein [Holophaga sp.]|nr:lipase family protein [Holophaga sp.]